MPKPELYPLNLGTIARGAALELFEQELLKIAANIGDSSTDAEATRELTLTFKFKPDTDRRSCLVTTRAKSKLAPIADHASKVYLGKSTEGQVLVFDTDPRQDLLFEPPAKDSTVLEFDKKIGS